MNDTNRLQLTNIVWNMQEDYGNIYRVQEISHLDDQGEIVEPKIFITMTDYRKLCRLAQTRDTLSKSIEAMRIEQEERKLIENENY